MSSVRIVMLGGAALAAIASSAQAGGFYLQEQSVRGAGRAYSGEVADTGVTSLWWNPASIAGSKGWEAHIGAHAVFVDADVRDAGSTITYPGGTTLPVRGEPRAFKPIQDGVAPNLAVATSVGPVALGLSVAAPYNFTTKYRRTAWARYDALESRLTTADVQLTAAMPVGQNFRIGVGVDAQHADAKLSTASPNLSPLLPDGVTQLSGDGWDWGWIVGAQGTFGPVTVGASYRSSVDHKLSGDVFVGGLLGPLAGGNVQTSGKAAFSTPWIATLGARWDVGHGLVLNGQVQRIGWGEFDAIRVTTAGGRQTLDQNYNDVTSGGVGFDYTPPANQKVTFRAGVQYDPTPTPDDERTARVPDGDRWIYGAGATVDIGHRLTLDLAAAYIDFSSSKVRHDTVFYPGTPAAVTTRLDGTVKGSGYVMSAGLTARF